jgi:hypothetical protein
VVLRETEDKFAAATTARADLATARNSLKLLRAMLWPLDDLLKHAAWVPRYGPNMAASARLLNASDHLLAAASFLDEGYGSLLEPMSPAGEGQAGGVAALLKPVVETAVPSTRAMRREVNAARSELHQIQRVYDLSPETQALVYRASEATRQAERTVTVLESLPVLLGTDGPHHVLILLQNADEIRPSGGYITASIYVVIVDGELLEVTVLPSDTRLNRWWAEDPWLPQLLEPYLGADTSLFRDANWSPDFPTSAQEASRLYQTGRGVPVETVIAVNQYAIRDFLAVLGEVRLEDGTVVTAATVLAMLRDLWTAYTSGTASPDIMPDLAPALLEEMLGAGDARTWPVYWRTAKSAAASGNLLIYSSDSSVEAMSQALGWDGGMRDEPGDYLYFVDTSIGASRADLNIERQLRYRVSLVNPLLPSAVLEISYTNVSPPQVLGCRIEAPRSFDEIANTCYGDYLRLYLPAGAAMLTLPVFELPPGYLPEGDPAAGQVQPILGEAGYEVFGGLMVVPPATAITATFAYTLPPSRILLAGPEQTVVYRLVIQKEPGVPAYPALVAVELPSGAHVLDLTVQPANSDARLLTFDFIMETDFELQILLSLPGDMRQVYPPLALPDSLAFTAHRKHIALFTVTPGPALPAPHRPSRQWCGQLAAAVAGSASLCCTRGRPS